MTAKNDHASYHITRLHTISKRFIWYVKSY